MQKVSVSLLFEPEGAVAPVRVNSMTCSISVRKERVALKVIIHLVHFIGVLFLLQ